MKFKDFPSVLPFVRKPSSYIGGEINTVNPAKTHLVSFALCFPDVYEIGTSHFGMQILYHLLNKMDNVLAERAFAPGQDMEYHLKKTGCSLFSLETGKPLNTFDVVGFSLLYELNYTNLLTILDLSEIPFYSEQRDDSYPLIIAGGPCMYNPEPVADFFDAVVIGDAESVVIQMAAVLLEAKNNGQNKDKRAVLKEWSRIKGVYIPQYYTPLYDNRGCQQLVSKEDSIGMVTRAILPALELEDFPDRPILPFGKPVHDRLRLEIARGCSRGCRFCQAGMIYRPVRERSVEDLLDLADAALRSTGYEDLSLLSLSTGDYSCLNMLMEKLVVKYGEKNISLSVPSFRAGSLDHNAMQLIKSVRKTGFTMAPEAGSQRLRDVINKNISEDEIARTVCDAFGLGWNLIKLYFMIGLPTETDLDVDEIIALVRRLSKIGNSKKGKQKLHVSVATFIPKAHTPFQWERQLDPVIAKDRLMYLKQKLTSRQVGFKWQNPETSFIEGVFARGDRRLSKLIEAAYLKGCRFDGWSDCFHFDHWLAAAAENNIDLDFYTQRQRETDEPLPWDMISSGISRDFFLKEREKAYQQERTADCRDGKCSNCGICDFSEISPRINQTENKTVSSSPILKNNQKQCTDRHLLEMDYAKKGPAGYFGHLEFINIFTRAMIRADIPLVYSQGFHPMPKIAFPDPLPVGVESEKETLVVTVSEIVDIEAVKTKLNAQLPEGITIKACRLSSARKQKKSTEGQKSIYRIQSGDNVFDTENVEHFLRQEHFFFEKQNKDGVIRKIDLKDIVSNLIVIDQSRLLIEIKDIPGKKVKPGDIAGALFGLTEATVKRARVVKIETI